MPFNQPPPSGRHKLQAGQIIGITAGIILGQYVGIYLLIPSLAAIAIWYVGSKLARPTNPHYLNAIAIQGAHFIWLAIGSALIGAWEASLDIVILGVGVVWLWLRPSILPVSLLSAFQVIALVMNSLAILGQPVSSPEYKSLTVHILLRLLALGAMWAAFIRSKRDRASL